jgi:hypothetical protein
LDEQGADPWKTAFNRVEGWYDQAGFPKRSTLEGLGLEYVADLLQAKNKLSST